jgi:hypothetical protein
MSDSIEHAVAEGYLDELDDPDDLDDLDIV